MPASTSRCSRDSSLADAVAAPAGDAHRLVDDVARGLGRAVLRAGELAEPVRPVIHQPVDVGGERLEIGGQRVEGERGIRDAPPDVGVGRVRSPRRS